MLRLLIALGILASLGASPRVTPEHKVLNDGVAYLMQAQGEDGGWHSETYGALRPGAAVTAHVLYAMAHVSPPLQDRYRDQLSRGYVFLQAGIREKGYVANPDGSADFPTYASAMTLVAARRIGLPMSAEDRRRLIDYLVSAQLTETRMFGPDSPHHGGWDFMGAQRIQGQTSGTNVSVTRHVLEALRDYDEVEVQAVRRRALRWTAGCQNLPGDGGFYFTPDLRSVNNKAQWSDEEPDDRNHPRSYGTTTCDGLGCLIDAGAERGDRRVKAAVEWLVDHPDVDAVPGFEDLADDWGWPEGLRFYYYAGLAKALHYLPDDKRESRCRALIAKLVELQRSDGSWKNESARMREDDPLTCTSFALTALGELLD